MMTDKVAYIVAVNYHSLSLLSMSNVPPVIANAGAVYLLMWHSTDSKC